MNVLKVQYLNKGDPTGRHIDVVAKLVKHFRRNTQRRAAELKLIGSETEKISSY